MLVKITPKEYLHLWTWENLKQEINGIIREHNIKNGMILSITYEVPEMIPDYILEAYNVEIEKLPNPKRIQLENISPTYAEEKESDIAIRGIILDFWEEYRVKSRYTLLNSNNTVIKFKNSNIAIFKNNSFKIFLENEKIVIVTYNDSIVSSTWLTELNEVMDIKAKLLPKIKKALELKKAQI